MKAREAEGRDDPKLALTEYYESLKLFQKLAWEYPEAPALSYTMGRVYLSAGAVAEGAGALGDAATLRGFAAKRFLKLASSEKDKTPEIEYQMPRRWRTGNWERPSMLSVWPSLDWES